MVACEGAGWRGGDSFKVAWVVVGVVVVMGVVVVVLGVE